MVVALLPNERQHVIIGSITTDKQQVGRGVKRHRQLVLFLFGAGEHISSFSSHIYGNVMIINSQYPQEVLIIYPEEGVYESIPLDAPLFAASVSPDGLFAGLDTQGNNLICIEIK